MNLLDRFIKYIIVDTQSSEQGVDNPTTKRTNTYGKDVQKGEDGRRIIIWEVPDTQTACKR